MVNRETEEESLRIAGGGEHREDVRALEVRGLCVAYRKGGVDTTVVDGVNLEVNRGEIVGLVGESGCGKTTTAMAVLRLLKPPGRITGGRALVGGTDLTTLDRAGLRRVRWKQVAFIPQGAMNSLNPILRVRHQIADVIEAHEGRQQRATMKERTLALLRTVGLPDRVYSMYPHELSGGMKQRVCIAMAVALSPSLIIADEPTSALDVVVQQRIALALRRMRDKLDVAILVIGHDLGLMAQLTDRVAVMNVGRIVETAPVGTLFKTPREAYTQRLIEAIPLIQSIRPSGAEVDAE